MGKCGNCGSTGSSLKCCSACKSSVLYCDNTCQKANWPDHRPICKEMRKRTKDTVPAASRNVATEQEDGKTPRFIISGELEDLQGDKVPFSYSYPNTEKELCLYRMDPKVGRAFVEGKHPAIERDLLLKKPWKCQQSSLSHLLGMQDGTPCASLFQH